MFVTLVRSALHGLALAERALRKRLPVGGGERARRRKSMRRAADVKWRMR